MEIKIKSSQKSAFTLIELIIVIAIVAMMTAVLLVNQKTGSAPKYDVDTAARELIALIHQAQTGATGGQQINGTPVCGMGIEWNTAATGANTAMTFYVKNNDSPANNALCPASGTNLAGGSTYGSAVSYKNVNINGGAGYVFFKLPFAGMTPGSPQQIVLSSKINSSVIHTICVYADTIKDSSGNLSC